MLQAAQSLQGPLEEVHKKMMRETEIHLSHNISLQDKSGKVTVQILNIDTDKKRRVKYISYFLMKHLRVNDIKQVCPLFVHQPGYLHLQNWKTQHISQLLLQVQQGFYGPTTDK